MVAITGMIQGGIIKAGDTLLFDVELLGFYEKAKEKWEMSAAELMQEAMKTKVKKVPLFIFGISIQYYSAIREYFSLSLLFSLIYSFGIVSRDYFSVLYFVFYLICPVDIDIRYSTALPFGSIFRRYHSVLPFATVIRVYYSVLLLWVVIRYLFM